MPWSNPDVQTFRSDIMAVVENYRGVIDPLTMWNAMGDILARLAIPDAPLPEPTPPPTPEPSEPPAAAA
jgi:hypothetical protein